MRGKENKLSRLSVDQKKDMARAGIDVEEKERSGTYIQIDHSVVHCKSLYPGLEFMSTTEAVRKYDWLKKYWWNAVPADTDEYTRETMANPHHGYFIRALPGTKSVYPLQSCLFLGTDGVHQNVHNVIIVEEDAELNVITGCTIDHSATKGFHIGISEFYVKKGAKLNFTMIHNWAENVDVRPRTVSLVEENGIFLSNYLCFRPVRSIQMYPKTILAGGNSVARYNSILYAHPGSFMDIGSRVILKAPNSRAEIIARTISAGGEIIARGHLRGEAPQIKAHLECRGLILSEKGRIHAIPELEGLVKDVDMSHEAAVGKIAQEEIEYLMSRGLASNEAQALIVRGFLDISIMGLPDSLKKEMDKAIASTEKEAL
jgi:hypothetical protein